MIDRFLPNRRRARSSAGLIGLVSALVVGLAGGFFARPFVSSETPKSPTTENATGPRATNAVSALGRIQPKGGVVPVYGPPGDRIAKWYDGVAVGATLKAGTPLIDLASKVERETEVAVARIQLDEARAIVDKARFAADAKIAAAELESASLTADEGADVRALNLQIDVLAKNKEYAAEQVRKIANLKAQKVSIPQDEQDQAGLLSAKAEAEWEAAKIKLTKAKDGYNRGRQLAVKKMDAAKAERDEAIARAPIESSRKKLELAEQMLALTTIKAPVDGTILSIPSRLGEPTGAQQAILHIADTSQLVVVAEVYESDVQEIWKGISQKNGVVRASIEAPALGEKLSGTVTRADQIGLMIARNAIFALSPREDADRRVVEVQIDVDPKDKLFPVARTLIGLQVRVTLTPPAGN